MAITSARPVAGTKNTPVVGSKGNLVVGTYRVTNGNAGTLRGTVTDLQMTLDVVHSVEGVIGAVVIDLDQDRMSGLGSWSFMELSGSRRAIGDFRTWKLDQGEASDSLERLGR